MELQIMNQKEHAETTIHKMDIPEDREGLSMVVTGPQVNGDSKNGAIDNKEPNDLNFRHTF